MSNKWIRNQASKVEKSTEKVTFYVNTESDPHIADWIRSIPYGETGRHVRAAIDFYLEHGQAVTPDKTSNRRKQSTRRPPLSTSLDVVRKTAPVPSPTLTAVEGDKQEANSEPSSTPETTPAVKSTSSPPSALKPESPVSNSVLDADEQEANSLDDIDPQALALQMELANRFSF